MAAGAGGLGQPASLLTHWADCPPISKKRRGESRHSPCFPVHLSRDFGVRAWRKGHSLMLFDHVLSKSQRWENWVKV